MVNYIKDLFRFASVKLIWCLYLILIQCLIVSGIF